MRLPCCEPHWQPWPSGVAWTHSRFCLDKPKRKLTKAEVTKLHEPEWHTAAEWELCTIPDCGACAYIEAHIDDLDDVGYFAPREPEFTPDVAPTPTMPPTDLHGSVKR